jgi:hypothetical protein
MFHKNAQVAGKIYEKHPSKMPRLQAPPITLHRRTAEMHVRLSVVIAIALLSVHCFAATQYFYIGMWGLVRFLLYLFVSFA